jgi:hypothetical protein
VGGEKEVSFTDAKILEIDEPAYRAYPGWSISQIKHLPQEAEWFHGLYVADPPLFEYNETAELVFGTQVHAEFLEGKICTQVPDWALTSNGQRRGKAWDAYREGHAAIECLSAKEIAAVQGMRRSIESQPKIANLLWGEGNVEQAVVAKDTETGLLVKGRIDKIRGDRRKFIVGDLKSFAFDSTDRRKVAARIHDNGYALQAAFYWDLAAAVFEAEPLDFVFVFAQKRAPWNVRAYPLNPNALEWGRRRYCEALQDLSRRLVSGDWVSDGHDDVTNAIDLPPYAYSDDPELSKPHRFEEFDAFSSI